MRPQTDPPPVPEEFLDFLRGHATFYLVTHTEPDGDCIASSLALGRYLARAMGRHVRHYNAGPFDRREIIRHQSEFSPRLDIVDRSNDPDPAVIILDCPGTDRIGDVADDIEGLPIAVIDHHASGKPFGNARFVDTTAAATCYLVQLVIEALTAETGAELTRDEAERLMFGLVTDTGFFRHVENDSAPLFRAVARLIDAGASPKSAHATMFGGQSLETRQLLATLLGRARRIGDGSAMLTYETSADTQRYGRVSRDSDTLYQLLFSIEGIRAAALIREEHEASCTGSLRSSDTLDVSRIAEVFGGGGHRRASGFVTKATLRETLEQVENEIEAALRADTARR